MAGKQGIFRVVGGVTRYIEVGKSKRVKENYELSKTHPTKCPGCGRDVFYYENDNGSQVYFEALGDSWPKHDCRRKAKQSIAKSNRKRKKKSFKSAAKQEKSSSDHKVTPLKNGVKEFDSCPDRSTETASERGGRKIKYPAFSLRSLELAFLVGVSHGPFMFALFCKSGLAVDNLKRNGVPILRGRYASLDNTQLSRLRKGYCNLPIYLAAHSKDTAVLKTHLLSDDGIQAFEFSVKLDEDLEKPLEDVIWRSLF